MMRPGILPALNPVKLKQDSLDIDNLVAKAHFKIYACLVRDFHPKYAITRSWCLYVMDSYRYRNLLGIQLDRNKRNTALVFTYRMHEFSRHAYIMSFLQCDVLKSTILQKRVQLIQ